MNGLALGVMTGTSLDAIDIALLSIKNSKPDKLMGFYSQPIPKIHKKEIQTLLEASHNEIHKASIINNKLSFKISLTINKFLKKIKVSPKQIMIVGVHGQTIRHNPLEGYSIQLCNPSIIAEKTKISVASDFRTRDIVRGGEGAPLAPVFHKEIAINFAPCAILNIGGIANITLIDNNKKNNECIVKGFDIGPGNCLSDIWCNYNLNKPYDNLGIWAKSGSLNQQLLKLMLKDPFFEKSSPKSTGIEYFNFDWINNFLNSINVKVNPENVQKTILELTAVTISNSIPRKYEKLFICGGGIKNKYLLERIRLNTRKKIFSTSHLGWKPECIEPACFAWLAAKTLWQQKVELNQITGSKNNGINGSITFA